MRIILEQILIGSGILGLMPMLLTISFHESMPEGFQFFRGSNIGDILTPILVGVGFIGVLFFFVNLFCGISSYWFIRLCPILFFFAGFVVVAVSARS